MAIQSANSNEPLSEINVTPFVDVMLVLLVIFMVTAPLVHQSVNVDLPETRSTQSATVTERDVVLSIDEKQQLFILKNQVALDDLTPKLREIFHDRPPDGREIFLRADKTLPYGFVVKVMALVKNAGIDRMGMITEPES